MVKKTKASTQTRVPSTSPNTALTAFRPMNIHVEQGSQAERKYRAMAGLPDGDVALADVLAPGFKPTRSHDLIFHKGKTIRTLTLQTFTSVANKHGKPMTSRPLIMPSLPRCPTNASIM